MSRQERVHERLEIRTPPLRECVADFPILVHSFSGKLRADRRETLVQSLLESFDLVIVMMKVIAWAIDKA